MITYEQYVAAQNIVDTYNEQLREENNKRIDELYKERDRKIKECEENGGHEYRYNDSKWSSVTQMYCMFCPKIIN